MKRREFLRSAVGLTGSLVPALAVAGKVPCPPEVLSVNSGTATKGACSAATDNGAVPRWVQDLPVNSGWQHVAGGADWPGLQPWQRGAQMVDVRMQPIPYAKGFAGMS